MKRYYYSKRIFIKYIIGYLLLRPPFIIKKEINQYKLTRTQSGSFSLAGVQWFSIGRISISGFGCPWIGYCAGLCRLHSCTYRCPRIELLSLRRRRRPPTPSLSAGASVMPVFSNIILFREVLLFFC